MVRQTLRPLSAHRYGQEVRMGTHLLLCTRAPVGGFPSLLVDICARCTAASIHDVLEYLST